MKHSFKRWVGDHGLIECAWLCDILDNGEIELVSANIRVGFSDFVCLLLRTDSGDNGVATLKECIKNVCCYEAAATLRLELTQSHP